MEIQNTYIQQLFFDGIDYTKGTLVDILKTFNIACQDFPFKKNPEAKELPTRDWAGKDGLDVYVPKRIPMKNYDIEVSFLYVGTEQTIRTDISNFIDFLYGRIPGAPTDEVISGRLAVYNEYVGMGRKDIVVSEVDNELFYVTDCDPDAVAMFKVKFTVYDPTTEVSTVSSTHDGQTIVTQLIFE